MCSCIVCFEQTCLCDGFINQTVDIDMQVRNYRLLSHSSRWNDAYPTALNNSWSKVFEACDKIATVYLLSHSISYKKMCNEFF